MPPMEVFSLFLSLPPSPAHVYLCCSEICVHLNNQQATSDVLKSMKAHSSHYYIGVFNFPEVKEGSIGDHAGEVAE